MIAAAEQLGAQVGIARACRVLAVPRSTLYRARQAQPEAQPRPTPPRALSAAEKAEVRAVLNSERFCDSAPREVYATLLDEDRTYLCHWRTMYRILHEHNEVRERRQPRQRPRRAKPELRATGPNQLWSWDITYLQGRHRSYYLYTIVDVYSRYVVGWMVATREGGDLAEHLITVSCDKHAIAPDELTLHADRGRAMRAKPVRQLLRDLGITESHSRPGTPTDNPYSEAHFKTLKYCPDYPVTFSTAREAREWVKAFVHWYNHEHHHTGLALMTPAMVHQGQVAEVREQRQQVLDVAYTTHPERFVSGRPVPALPPQEVWINPPTTDHPVIRDALGPVASDRQPGAAINSRAQSGATIDRTEHPVGPEHTSDPTHDPDVSLFELESELSQHH